jgi:hypothetical protein
MLVFQSNFYRDKPQPEPAAPIARERRVRVGFRNNNTTTAAKTNVDENHEKRQITFTLLSLWVVDPILAIAVSGFDPLFFLC